MRWPLGVVDVVYARRGDVAERALAARADGFAHIDPLVDSDPTLLALPIGCPTAFPKPVDTWCSTPAPSARLEGAWERAVRWWRAAPRALMEPWAGAVVNSFDSVRAFRAEVGDIRILVDTGHVADWGGDSPSSATRSPGSASVTNSVRRSSPPKQQFVVSPSPTIGRKSTTVPSRSTIRTPCSMVDAT